jgi:hypothetical protein
MASVPPAVQGIRRSITLMPVSRNPDAPVRRCPRTRMASAKAASVTGRVTTSPVATTRVPALTEPNPVATPRTRPSSSR